MIPPLSTLKAYVIVGAVLAAGIGGAVGAWKAQDWRYGALEAERMEQERETAVMRRKAANTAAKGFEQDKVRIQTEFVTIEKEVERVVNQIEYRDRACLTDDGLRSLQAAIRLTGNPGELGNTVPTPAAD
jgi:hypothetical protein